MLCVLFKVSRKGFMMKRVKPGARSRVKCEGCDRWINGEPKVWRCWRGCTHRLCGVCLAGALIAERRFKLWAGRSVA